MCSLTVKDIMWSDGMITISPETTLKEAAAKMLEVDAGVLPVVTDGRLEGIITDRDIVIRAVCTNKTPDQEKVAFCMTTDILTCREEDDILTAAKIMKENEIGRLAVLDADGKLTGILSFGHIFRNDVSAEDAADLVMRVKGGERIVQTNQLSSAVAAT